MGVKGKYTTLMVAGHVRTSCAPCVCRDREIHGKGRRVRFRDISAAAMCHKMAGTRVYMVWLDVWSGWSDSLAV
jgi:hypothetical protein